MTEPRKKPGRPRTRDETFVIQVRVDADLFAALEEQIVETRRTKNVELVIALEAHLRAAGRWPRKSGRQPKAKEE